MNTLTTPASQPNNGDKKQKEQILRLVERERVIVENFFVNTIKEQSPLLSDITELQKEDNR